MNIAYIQTTNTVSIIVGDTFVIDMVGDNQMLYVYAGERLTGVFRLDSIIDAHLTERK